MAKTTNKPWGSELLWAESNKYAGKILRIKGGHRLSRQLHLKKDETIFVMKGQLTVELGNGEAIRAVLMNEGESLRIRPGTIHRFIAEHEEAILIEVSTPELEDVVRLEDLYGRDTKASA